MRCSEASTAPPAVQAAFRHRFPHRSTAWLSGGSPPTPTRLSLPFAKNPIDLLSGDQNGPTAPSVPPSRFAVSESSGRSQRNDVLPTTATNARYRPSGDSASGFGPEPASCKEPNTGPRLIVAVSGTGMATRTSDAAGVGRR